MGLLQAYDSPNFVNLYNPDLMKDPDNFWVGVYVGTLASPPIPTGWLSIPALSHLPHGTDLLKPEFTDQVMVGAPVLPPGRLTQPFAPSCRCGVKRLAGNISGSTPGR